MYKSMEWIPMSFVDQTSSRKPYQTLRDLSFFYPLISIWNPSYVTTTIPNAISEEVSRMQNAIAAFHSRIGVSRRELAKDFNVCDVRLGRRNKGHGPGNGRPGTNNALNPYQEYAYV